MASPGAGNQWYHIEYENGDVRDMDESEYQKDLALAREHIPIGS